MTTTPIADQSTELQAAAAGQLPAAVLAAFGGDIAEQVEAGVHRRVATIGTRLDDAELVDAHGIPTTLAQALGGKPAVIVFYRGAWCPYCNLALRTYQAELVGPLVERGASLVAISPQTPDGSLTIAETNALTFDVLSDAGNKIAGQLGILTEANAAGKAAQLALGLDVAATNADGTPTVPMPTTVIVDENATIRWVDVHAEYVKRSEPVEILAAYDSAL